MWVKRFWDGGGMIGPQEYDPAQLGAGFAAYSEKEREYMRKALDLAGTQNGAYNIAPVLDLVRQADALGFEVVKKRPTE